MGVFFIWIATETYNITLSPVCKRLFQKHEKKHHFHELLMLWNAMICWIHRFQLHTYWGDASSWRSNNRKIEQALKRSLSDYFQRLNAFSVVFDYLKPLPHLIVKNKNIFLCVRETRCIFVRFYFLPLANIVKVKRRRKKCRSLLCTCQMWFY